MHSQDESVDFTCDHDLSEEDLRLPDGTIMGTALKKIGTKFAGVVMEFVIKHGEEREPEILWEGKPCRTQRTAQRDAMRRYWPLYEFRNGFKHPDDPSRGPRDPEPTMSVMSMRSDDWDDLT
jgi:hypothetical protein